MSEKNEMQLLARAAVLETLRTEGELLAELTRTLADVGIDYWIYLSVADDDRPIVLSNIELHGGASDGVFDPFLDYCCDGYEATLTSVEYLDDHPYLDQRACDFIRKAGTMGFRSGLGIPVRTVGSPVYGGFNLGTSLRREAFERDIVPMTSALRSFCLIAHRQVEAVARAEAGDGGEIAVPHPGRDALDTLTRREVDILSVLAQGSSRQQCAARFGISEHTVAAHTRNIYAKLGVSNRVEAAALAITGGMASDRPAG